MNVIYEVNLSVDADVAADYERWLRPHVAQMLALPGFLDAEMFAVREPQPGRVEWSVQYRLVDMPALEAYFDHHAERMRADGSSRFPGRFTATRRILHPVVR